MAAMFDIWTSDIRDERLGIERLHIYGKKNDRKPESKAR